MKRICLTSVMFLIAGMTYAQGYNYGRGPSSDYNRTGYTRQSLTQVGLKGAFAGSTVSGSSITSDFFGSDYQTSTSRLVAGFTAGIFVESTIGRGFAIQPEFIYSMKGGSYSHGYTTDRDRLSYLSVPILLKFKPMPGLGIYIGPEVGYLIDAQNRYEGDDQDGYRREATTNIRDFYHKVDVDLAFGISFDIMRNLGIDARYSAGLTNISKDGGTYDNGDAVQTTQVTNNSFQVGMYVKF